MFFSLMTTLDLLLGSSSNPLHTVTVRVSIKVSTSPGQKWTYGLYLFPETNHHKLDESSNDNDFSHRGPQSTVHSPAAAGLVLSGGSEEKPPLVSLPSKDGCCPSWCSSACRHITPVSNSIFTSPSFLCLCVSFFSDSHKDTLVRCRAHSNQVRCVVWLHFHPFLNYICVCVPSHFSHVQLFATLWTVAHQAPLSMEFSSQKYWSGLPFLSPGDLPHPEIEPCVSYVSCDAAMPDGFFITSATWEAQLHL